MLPNDPNPLYEVGQSVVIERPVIIRDFYINPPQFKRGLYYKVAIDETGREMQLVFAEDDLGVPDYRKHLKFALRNAGMSLESSAPIAVGQFCAANGFTECPYFNLAKRLEWIWGYHSASLQLSA